MKMVDRVDVRWIDKSWSGADLVERAKLKVMAVAASSMWSRPETWQVFKCVGVPFPIQNLFGDFHRLIDLSPKIYH